MQIYKVPRGIYNFSMLHGRFMVYSSIMSQRHAMRHDMHVPARARARDTYMQYVYATNIYATVA